MNAIRFERLPETTVVPGKRLGRHIRHDPRSRDFAVQTDTSGLVSVRHHRHVPIYDQGETSSCTGNAGAGALSTAPFPHRFTEHRALVLYSQAETIDGDGPYPPNDNGSSGLSIAKACKADGLISSYSHCFTPDAVYTALQTGPVLIGCSWLTGFDQPTASGQMVYAGQSRGGHEILADQLDVDNGRIWITNSWSSSWGDEGRAWWTWADFERVLADSGDATVLHI